MEIKLQKWGNSLGIRIPSSILKSQKLKENGVIELKEDENRIIITKQEGQTISLLERFKNYKGDNLAKEFTWDEPRGEEIW